jgi:hypothetical protein
MEKRRAALPAGCNPAFYLLCWQLRLADEASA